MIRHLTQLIRILRENISIRPTSKQIFIAVAACFGAAVFLVSELMHYLLVPELGRHGERMVAEAVSGVIVGYLAAQLFHAIVERREATLARLQVISEMNHHVRNALAAISLSADEIQNQQSVRFILESVDRIEWTLREILPRDKPVPEEPDRYLRPVSWRKAL
jgi:signal transduction histidine kinase